MRWMPTQKSRCASWTAEEGQTLNRDFRKKDYATNVLTFDYTREPVVTADLVLCAPVVATRGQANRARHLQAHYAHLIVHGTLHAQGWDHEQDNEATAMEQRETDILLRLGFGAPVLSPDAAVVVLCSGQDVCWRIHRSASPQCAAYRPPQRKYPMDTTPRSPAPSSSFMACGCMPNLGILGWRTSASRRYQALAASWPGDASSTEATRNSPTALAGYGVTEIADHIARQIQALDSKPILIGHSFGGLIVQNLLARELAVVAIAIDPAPIKGVKELPWASLRAASPCWQTPSISTAPCRSLKRSFGMALPTPSRQTRPARCTSATPCPPRRAHFFRRQRPCSTRVLQHRCASTTTTEDPCC